MAAGKGWKMRESIIALKEVRYSKFQAADS